MNIHKNISMNNHNFIAFMRKKKVVTTSEVAKYMKISWNTAEKYLLELVISGRIEKLKKDGVNLWLVKK